MNNERAGPSYAADAQVRLVRARSRVVLVAVDRKVRKDIGTGVGWQERHPVRFGEGLAARP